MSPIRRQAIIWTNTCLLSIGTLGTNCSQILIASDTFSFKKIRLKMSSAKWRQFWTGGDELITSTNWPGNCCCHDALTHLSGDEMADIFRWISLNEGVWTSIRNSLEYVPEGPVDKTAAGKVLQRNVTWNNDYQFVNACMFRQALVSLPIPLLWNIYRSIEHYRSK